MDGNQEPILVENCFQIVRTIWICSPQSFSSDRSFCWETVKTACGVCVYLMNWLCGWTLKQFESPPETCCADNHEQEHRFQFWVELLQLPGGEPSLNRCHFLYVRDKTDSRLEFGQTLNQSEWMRCFTLVQHVTHVKMIDWGKYLLKTLHKYMDSFVKKVVQF